MPPLGRRSNEWRTSNGWISSTTERGEERERKKSICAYFSSSLHFQTRFPSSSSSSSSFEKNVRSRRRRRRRSFLCELVSRYVCAPVRVFFMGVSSFRVRVKVRKKEKRRKDAKKRLARDFYGLFLLAFGGPSS